MNRQPIQIAYFGSPDFSADVLESLIKSTNIKLVCTQPDRPLGRKKIQTPTPVKKIAVKNNIPCITHLPSGDELKHKGIDLAVVYAYRHIIPESLLQAPRYGFWNIHPSLLPLYRGPAPVAYPIILGDTMTGVSLIQMDKFMDHGPVIAQKNVPIQDTDTHPELLKKLSQEGLNLVQEAILENQLLNIKEQQDHKRATYTDLLTREDGYIEPKLLQDSLNGNSLDTALVPNVVQRYIQKNKIENMHTILEKRNSAFLVYNLHRGLWGWPGIWTYCQFQNVRKRLKIIDASIVENGIKVDFAQIEGKKPTAFSNLQKNSSFFIT